MENVKGSVMQDFPLKEALKVDDIVVIDHPILSRYTFEGKQYLYFHVDDDNNFDTYLVFKIDDYALYKLVSGNVSLRQTILEIENFVFLIDVDRKGAYIKTMLVYSTDVIEDYLPDEESFLKLKFVENSYYTKLLEKHAPHFHTERLKKHAFYIKFSPKSSKHGETIGLGELAEKLLPKVTAAYKNYSRADFYNKFKAKITDPAKLIQTYNRISDLLQFRIVETAIGSFEMGIAADNFTQVEIEDKEIKNWANHVGENFKEDVLNINLEDSEQYEKITSKFDDEQRAKIYQPIIDLAQDKNTAFTYKPFKQSKYHPLKKITQNTIKSLIPVKPTETIAPEFEVVKFATIVEKGKTKTINISDALQLFDEEQQFQLHAADFADYPIMSGLDAPIDVEIISMGGKIELFAQFEGTDFNVDVETKNLAGGKDKLIKRIAEYTFDKTQNH